MTIDAACDFLATARTNLVLGERVAGVTSLRELLDVARDEGFDVSTSDLRLLCRPSRGYEGLLAQNADLLARGLVTRRTVEEAQQRANAYSTSRPRTPGSSSSTRASRPSARATATASPRSISASIARSVNSKHSSVASSAMPACRLRSREA